jgi:putative DNA modification/repair radical SAM protein
MNGSLWIFSLSAVMVALSAVCCEAELPEGLKGIVPEYPGSSVKLIIMAEEGARVHLETDAEPDVAIDFYKKAMAEKGIYRSFLPSGKCITLFKILQTNACVNDCFYCVNRCSHRHQRLAFTPDDLAKTFIELWGKGHVEGLFLSSGVRGSADRTMEEMVKTVEILRKKYRYRDYVHLKIIPGASKNLVVRATELADRISVNLEAPNDRRLKRIAPDKRIKRDIIRQLLWAKGQREKGLVPAGITTQFVVGPAGETDKELIRSTDWLYQNVELARAYFSGYVPVHGPLQGALSPSALREHRLYQVDWLLRKYGFSFEEIPFDKNDNLPLEVDPKMAWALRHPERFPIEINNAPREELLRIPGIGSVSARKIISERRRSRLKSLENLKGLRIPLDRARDFVLLNGRFFPSSKKGKRILKERQLLFDI